MNTALCKDDNELMERMLATVAGLWGVSRDELCRKPRDGRDREARQVAMYLGWSTTSLSTPEIGRAMGGLDHSLVIYSRETVRKRMEDGPLMRERVENLVALLGSFKREPMVAEKR